MPEGNGSSGGGETDWGGVIEDVGGLVDELFDGDFWDWLTQMGCMSSEFKLKYLKDNFPGQINAMRKKAGVDMSMSLQNVNDFSKRLSHLYAALSTKESGQKGSCKGDYRLKFIEMLGTYMTELHSLLLSSGFVVANVNINNLPGTNGLKKAENYSQSDIQSQSGWMGFGHTVTFFYRAYEVDQNYTGGGGYTVIDEPVYDGGGGIIPGGWSSGGITPTLSSFNVMNYALGGLLLFGFYKYAKENKILK